MASLDKANKSFQRLHRERHQPEARRRFGFLEKKKDYKKRALDYQNKQKTLKKLKEKVINKNPNEFHFHMLNSQLIDGRHYEKRKDAEDPELIVANNQKYLNWKRSVEIKKIDRLKSSLHFIDIDGKPKNTHTFFCEKPEEKLVEVKQRVEIAPQLGGRILNVPDSDTLKHTVPINISRWKLKMLAKERNKSYKMLMRRIEREKKLKSLIVKNDFSLKPKKSRLDPFDD